MATMRKLYEQGTCLYLREDVSASADTSTLTTRYFTQDSRVGWQLDQEGNHYINTNFNHLLVRKELKSHGGWFSEGKNETIFLEKVWSKSEFDDACRRWSHPEPGTPEYDTVQVNRALAECKKISVEEADTGPYLQLSCEDVLMILERRDSTRQLDRELARLRSEAKVYEDKIRGQDEELQKFRAFESIIKSKYAAVHQAIMGQGHPMTGDTTRLRAELEGQGFFRDS